MKKIISALLFIALVLSGCNNSSTKKTLTHDEIMAAATRTEKNGWINVHLEGSPDVIGYQHGFLLAAEIIELRSAIDVLGANTSGRDWNFYREESYKMFWPHMPEEYRTEITGIANGVNKKLGEGTIDIKDLVAMNSTLEMAGYYVPWLDNTEKPKPPEHCSAFAATGSWTADGGIVMAHNNWTEYIVGERWNIIFDIIPQKGNRILMDAPPGFIHSGDDFSINSAGLIVTETTISAFKGFDSTGVAEFVRARESVQYAMSIDEWVAIMGKNNNGGYANDWLIGDNKTGEIARYELGLKNDFLERTRDGYFIGANFPVNEKLIREETSFDPSSPDVSANMRRKRWEVLISENKGKITVESAKAFMADHYDMNRNKVNAGRFTLCGHLDADSAGTRGMNWDAAYYPAGAVQAKATDKTLATKMQLWAIMGHPCGEPFIAADFLALHPEYNYQKALLRDMPRQEWTIFGTSAN
jgi:hypothetical protein